MFAADGLDQRAQRVGLADVGLPVFPSRSPSTGMDVIQAGTSTPWRLAAMAQAKKELASLMA